MDLRSKKPSCEGCAHMNDSPKIVPCLWFDEDCEEAIDYYMDAFNSSPHRRSESRLLTVQRYEKGMEVPGADHMEGKILTAVFELDGQRLMALDGGPVFKFTEAVSLCVECEDQAEVDHFWELLSAVPESEQCGWVKDRFGLSWQIVPRRLDELLASPNRAKALAALNAMLPMKKLVIADLQKAFDEA